ncbi:MAG: hypothetical protein KDK08_24725 [Rhizobiaceae bacterium]|nr:hypothetical protein [Rhizobiaceae bacterium]
MREVFMRSERDGGGFSQSDIEVAEKSTMARMRASAVSSWLQRDLDGDTKVSRAELEVFFIPQARRPLRSASGSLPPNDSQAAEILAGLVDKAMQADANVDGLVDLQEMIKTVDIRPRHLASRSNQIPFELDRNGDGSVSEAEFMEIVNATLATIDSDNNGFVSSSEAQSIREQVDRARKRMRVMEQARRSQQMVADKVNACGLPNVTDGTEIILVEAYEGQALSAVALGDQNEEVSVADVVVEPGDQPIYLVLGSHRPTIWRLSGAVDRLTRVVASAAGGHPQRMPSVGIVGVQKDVVYIPPTRDCLPYFNANSAVQQAKALGVLNTSLGRKPDVVIASYDVNKIAVPSGQHTKQNPFPGSNPIPEEGPAAEVWQEFKRFYPGGIVVSEPGSVVSSRAAALFDVLPQEAGLAQLVESGVLRIVGYTTSLSVRPKDGEGGSTQIVMGGGADRIILSDGSKPILRKVPGEYLIVKKMTFPAGLSGAHAAKFVLAPGVPKPQGDPGHSCVIEQDSGVSLGNRTC